MPVPSDVIKKEQEEERINPKGSDEEEIQANLNEMKIKALNA